mgnify:CR=1 FL=1
MSGEKDRVDAYLGTVARLEPDIAMMDTAACLPSIAISLKRIADALDGLNGAPDRLRPIEHIAAILWSKS